MRQAAWLAGISVLVLAFGVAGCACCGSSGGSSSALAATDIAQKNCPVMGGKINPKIYTDYEGRRVYFCCPACIPVFKKDPAKYIAKVDAELKANQKPADAKAAEPANK
jgi:YHS domain-containing protein